MDLDFNQTGGPDAPGVGFELKRELIEVMRSVAA